MDSLSPTHPDGGGRRQAEPRTPSRKRAVLLINLGTPDEATVPAVRRYLAEFLSDPERFTALGARMATHPDRGGPGACFEGRVSLTSL